MRLLYCVAATALALSAQSAFASTVVLGNCVSVTDPAGCLFNGNISGNPNPANVNSFKNAENAYNAARNPDITLNYLTDTNAGNFGTFGSFTGGGMSSGTWSLPGFSVDYIAVKASNQFVLYAVSGSSGSWDTFDIPFQNNPHAISHLVFFGNRVAVPEPATWLTMILGFGLLGATMRRRTGLRFA